MIAPSVPLIDLHRHLEGSVRLQTIFDLGRRYNVAIPAHGIADLKNIAQVTAPQPGVMEFIARIRWTTRIFAHADACRRVAAECVEDAAAEGIDYLELRFSPWFMAEPHGLDPVAVVDAVVDGASAGAQASGLAVGLIGVLSRTYGPEVCRRELEALLARRDALVALDLAGDEAGFPAPLFREHFRRARDLGLGVTVHAGEAAGAASIRDSIEQLGATRIGHAVRAIDDPALMDLMRERRVGIEANLTSNVQTRTVPDYASHPLKAFLERGLLATINSDDPAVSGIDLVHEYRVAAPAAGLTPEQIETAQRNALAIAFLDDAARERLARGKSPVHGLEVSPSRYPPPTA